MVSRAVRGNKGTWEQSSEESQKGSLSVREVRFFLSAFLYSVCPIPFLIYGYFVFVFRRWRRRRLRQRSSRVGGEERCSEHGINYSACNSKSSESGVSKEGRNEQGTGQVRTGDLAWVSPTPSRWPLQWPLDSSCANQDG